MAKANFMANLNVKRQEVQSTILQEELQKYMAKDLDIRTGEEMALARSGDCGFRSSLKNLQICVS